MAIVNYSVTSPSLTTAVEMELSDADSERMIQWLMAATPYGTVTENVITDIPNPAWSPDQEDPLDPPEYIRGTCLRPQQKPQPACRRSRPSSRRRLFRLLNLYNSNEGNSSPGLYLRSRGSYGLEVQGWNDPRKPDCRNGNSRWRSNRNPVHA